MKKNKTEIIKKIKDFIWDNRVQRAGLLQPKYITIIAETIPIQLTKNTVVKYDSMFWINDFNLYDNDRTDSFALKFKKAFKENKKWPLRIIDKFNKYTIEVNECIKTLNSVDFNKLDKDKKLKLFNQYYNLLTKIQNYYVIAVPLTDFCEKELKNKKIKFLDYAFSYKKLDINKYEVDLKKLKLKNGSVLDNGIKKFIEQYSWINTSYNINKRFSKKEILNQLKQNSSHSQKYKKYTGESSYLIEALQVGIFLRNRMKEVSQQLWYYVEPLARSIAKDLRISRDNFFQLTPQEVNKSLNKNKCFVSQKEFSRREKGFAIGKLNQKNIFVFGTQANILYNYFKKLKLKNGARDFINGVSASPGRVTGKIKIVINSSQFNKFKSNEILVTSMTTPDFVVLMKKAKAIITDEGGLSCHAAIVSRELKIPCVIGTKIATELFKDGDLVEVDANKGIVRKIIK